jgi:enoyl-CoA hydratase/carnithine racemase
MIDFQTHPDRYRHWKLRIEAPIAYLTMDVDPEATLRPGYELKMNSYDLGVDIELYDAVQRLRFEHPEVRAVVLDSAKERIFCAGANIRMLGHRGCQRVLGAALPQRGQWHCGRWRIRAGAGDRPHHDGRRRQCRGVAA